MRLHHLNNCTVGDWCAIAPLYGHGACPVAFIRLHLRALVVVVVPHDFIPGLYLLSSPEEDLIWHERPDCVLEVQTDPPQKHCMAGTSLQEPAIVKVDAVQTAKRAPAGPNPSRK
eukprot:scaffold2130_cov402-Prasinococcus_capsulatus_cf.AAC.10